MDGLDTYKELLNQKKLGKLTLLEKLVNFFTQTNYCRNFNKKSSC